MDKLKVILDSYSSGDFVLLQEKITWRQGEILSYLISVVSPKNVLELGTSYGFSLFWMLNGSLDSSYTSVEICPNKCEFVRDKINQCGLTDKVNIICSDVYDALRLLDDDLFDFVFIDALQKDYVNLFNFLREECNLGEGCVVIFDNILSHRKSDVVNQCRQEELDYYIIDEGSGFLVVIL